MTTKNTNADEQSEKIKEKLIQKEIARRNKIFNGKTDQEKRVLVAKDVLALIKSKVIFPMAGEWVEAVYSEEFLNKLEQNIDSNEKKSAQNALIGGDIEVCACCGLGGMFVSCTLFNNNVNCADLESVAIGEEIKYGNKFSNGLNTIFSDEQLKLIEIAFEKGKGSFGDFNLEDEDYDAAIIFGERYISDKSRLIAIMENIIKNKGEFIPKVSKGKK